MMKNPGESENGGEKTLLLVEDEALIALSEAQMLSKHGFRVMTSHNGPSAIETVRDNRIDLVLMDIDLGRGKMDGTEAARIILTTNDVPIVFLSSHTEPEVVDKTDKITAYGYVVKNTGETVLINAIKMAFKLFEAKSELERSKKTLEVALDNSHAGIAIADAPDGRLSYVNDAGLLIRGGDREEIVNGIGIDRYVSSWRIKDLDGRALQADEVPLARAIMYGETNSRQFIVEREDHEDRIVMANAAPILSKDGVVESAIVIFLDVTEFKQMEKQLHRTNTMLERTEEIAHVGGWEWEVGTDTVVWSKELYRITGLDPNDPPPPFNEDHHKIYTEESWRLLTERVENTLKTGEEYEILAQMVRPDGEHREVAIYGGARFGPDATVTGLYGIVQDITSRRKMERAFWSQEEDLRITLESIGDAVISTDVRGTVLRMNPVAQRLTGWLFSDAEGKLLREVFRIENGETGAKVEDPVEQVLRTGRTIGLANHTKLVSKNGREYHIADSAAPIKDAVGRTRGVVLVFHDVTEEYELRRSLRRNEERLRSLFASMTEGVCLHRLVYDESGTPVNYTIQDVNPAFERMLKLSRENVIGKRATEAYRTEQPPYLEEYAAVAATGVSRQLEVYYEPMDTHFVISVFATEPDSFATVFLDVGDLQRARDELRAQRDFIEQIAETSPVSIVKVDKDGHVVYANRHAEAVLGIARDSLSNRSYADVQWDIKDLAGEPLPAEELPFRKVMARGEPVYDVRHSISWPEDRRILLSVNAAPLYAANGDFDGMVASITDITQRHHNEVRLQAALAEKDLLMKELNHRVKNNLAMITSLIELKVGELDDSQSFSGIIRQINSIHLIHDKLYRTGEITVVDARDYFTDLLRSIFDSFAAQPVALDLKLAETRISVRRAVPLGLIVNEIATNAIQHGFHSGGPHVFRATLAEDAERNRIVLTLSNSGGPFPDEIRLENPQSFGLRLISALIEQLEGTIDLQRRPYPVFTISIPREQ